MALRYCFENPIKVLQKSKPHDLAVVDTDGQTMVIYPYFMEKNNELYSLDY